MMKLPTEAKMAFGVAMVQCIVSAVSDKDVNEGNYFARIEEQVSKTRRFLSLTSIQKS